MTKGTFCNGHPRMTSLDLGKLKFLKRKFRMLNFHKQCFPEMKIIFLRFGIQKQHFFSPPYKDAPHKQSSPTLRYMRHKFVKIMGLLETKVNLKKKSCVQVTTTETFCFNRCYLNTTFFSSFFFFFSCTFINSFFSFDWGKMPLFKF